MFQAIKLLKSRRIVGNHHIRGKMWSEKRNLECLPSVIPRVYFKVKTFPHIILKELMGLGFNICVVLRKPLISKANWKKVAAVSKGA